jgi:hypothetical protein
MTEQEAKNADISPDRRKYYFRQDGEGNLLPPAERSTWYEKVSVDLCNAPNPEESDKIGVVVPWTYRKTGKIEITPVERDRILDTIRKGGPWRKDAQAEDWVGEAVATVLGINLTLATDKKKVAEVVRAWLKDDGPLECYPGKNKQRKPCACVRVKEPGLPFAPRNGGSAEF